MSEPSRTPSEEAAIRALKRLAKTWPKSLWLFAASNSLCVMRVGADGKHAINSLGGMDPDYCLATIKIDSDGGDW